MTNPERRALLDRHRQSEFPGSIVDVLAAARQGRDLIAEFESQKGMQVANTPGERQQGLRPSHQAGDTEASMAFPNTPPNQEFNTMGMKAPIDIKQFNDRGNLVKSYEAVPPGVSNLKMSSQGGTVIETPTKMQFGGQVDNTRVATPQPPQYQYQLNPPPQSPYRDQGTITPDKSSFNAWRDEDSLFENTVEFFDPTGITSWDDARRAYNSMKNRGASSPNLDEGLDMFGAIPLFGKAKLGINLAKGAAKRPKDVVNAAKKGYNYLTKSSDIINRVDAIEDEVGFLDPKQRGTVIETPTRMQAGGAPLDYRIAQELAKRKGNTPEFYLASADTIGYHESGPDQRMAINALQEPVPTGRGTFQIEGKDGSNTLETSQKHLRRTMGYWGETPPQNIMDSRDAAELTYEEQRALMLAHLLQGPMPMADYASGKAKLADVWATGWKKKFKSPEDRQLGINKFNASRLHAKKEGIPEPNYIKRKLGGKKRK